MDLKLSLRKKVVYISILIFFTLLLAFILLGLMVKNLPQNSFDTNVAEIFYSLSNPALDKIMIFVSWFGYFPASLLILLTLSAWLYKLLGEKGFLVAGILSILSIVSETLKVFTERLRPEIFLTEGYKVPQTFSFPSGHVSFYTLIFGFALVLALIDKNLDKNLRKVVVLFSILMIILVGFSRIYLGVHWPTDVLGGYLLGLILLETILLVYRKMAGKKFPLV